MLTLFWLTFRKLLNKSFGKKISDMPWKIWGIGTGGVAAVEDYSNYVAWFLVLCNIICGYFDWVSGSATQT
jgi:hypothetical protein